MKRLVLIIIPVLILGGILFLSGGCDSEEEKGNITFWTDENIWGGDISVIISGHGTRIITGYHEGAVSVWCETEFTARFSNLPYGEYIYTASNSYYSWSGSISLKQDCYTILLNRWNGTRQY